MAPNFAPRGTACHPNINSDFVEAVRVRLVNLLPHGSMLCVARAAGRPLTRVYDELEGRRPLSLATVRGALLSLSPADRAHLGAALLADLGLAVSTLPAGGALAAALTPLAAAALRDCSEVVEAVALVEADGRVDGDELPSIEVPLARATSRLGVVRTTARAAAGEGLA